MTRKPVRKARPIHQATVDRRDYTLRPDDATWERLKEYCRTEEDREGRPPSRNAIILEALNEWLDQKGVR